ncbi:MAG: hypothetical protein C3F11_21900 [Methylocystaceae bacterium]|nr:MAG: hypothetical protein C3F11_21900 [Methylocystaceae bacterium]
MSNINDIVQSAQGGRLAENLSHRFGLAPWQTEAAILALIPALSAGFRKAVEEPASLRPLIGAVQHPQHAAAFESADSAYSEEAVARGGEIVDRLFGSPATAGQVAQLAARESSVRADILQQLLPVLASIVAGGLLKALDKEGRASVLGQLAGEPSAAAAEATQEGGAPEAAAAKAPSGGLLTLLTGLVGALFGGRPEQKTSAEAPPPAAPASEADPLQEALNHIRETFAPGAAASADHQASLDELLGDVFGSWKS